MLQSASHGGASLLIPGAREQRAAPPTVQPVRVASVVVPAVAATADSLPGRGQLEREREGGGAPGERRRDPDNALIVKLRRWLFPRD
jgi:hypothetical protein